MKNIFKNIKNKKRPAEIIYKFGADGEMVISIEASTPGFIAAIATMVRIFHDKSDATDREFVEIALKKLFAEGTVFDNEKMLAEMEEMSKGKRENGNESNGYDHNR